MKKSIFFILMFLTFMSVDAQNTFRYRVRLAPLPAIPTTGLWAVGGSPLGDYVVFIRKTDGTFLTAVIINPSGTT